MFLRGWLTLNNQSLAAFGGWRKTRDAHNVRVMTSRAHTFAKVPYADNTPASLWASLEERYVVSVFLDLCGYTAFCERASLSEIVLLLARFRARVEGAAEHFGGVVEGYAGDGAAVFFISDGAHAVTERAALRFSQRVRDDAAACGADAGADAHADVRRVPVLPVLPVSIGVSAGLAAVGSVSDVKIVTWSVIGRGNNLASRLSALAGPNEIWVDAAIANEHAEWFGDSPPRAQSIRGLSNEILIRVLAPYDEPSVVDPSDGDSLNEYF